MPEKAVELFIRNFLSNQRDRKTAADQISCRTLFQGLSESSLQSLLGNSHINDFTAKQTLVHQGDRPDYLYSIISGSIKTLRYNSEGKETTIRMLGSGDTFMDAVIFMGDPSPVSVETTEDSTLLMIPADAVRRHALHDSQFAYNLLKIVTEHYKNAIYQIDSISTKNPTKRVGYYLLKLHIDQNHDSLDLLLPFQKSTVASHLGMTPETFSRALSQLKKLGVTPQQDKISLRDAYVLCHFCDPETASVCPDYNSEKCPLCIHGTSCH